jgi:hypothetical protein
MLSYYEHAVARSWTAAWEWATGQGIILTWLLAGGVVVAAIVFAALRAISKHHSWRDALNDAKKAVLDFFLAAVASSFLVLAFLFAVFFVRDAPKQAVIAENTISSLKVDNARTIAGLKEENGRTVAQLKSEMANLQSRLNDRDIARRAQQLRDEQINDIAGMIAAGNAIAKTFEERDDKDLIRSQYSEWEKNALEILSTKFGVGYLAQFGSARGTALMLVNHNIEGDGWYALLQGKLAVLNGFISELRKQ